MSVLQRLLYSSKGYCWCTLNVPTCHCCMYMHLLLPCTPTHAHSDTTVHTYTSACFHIWCRHYCLSSHYLCTCTCMYSELCFRVYVGTTSGARTTTYGCAVAAVTQLLWLHLAMFEVWNNMTSILACTCNDSQCKHSSLTYSSNCSMYCYCVINTRIICLQYGRSTSCLCL
jgi:hypothetical protein